MADSVYPDPVGRLLNLGEPDGDDPAAWPDYAAKFGIGREHIPDLIRLAGDLSLNDNGSDSSTAWGPMHAWRSLGQLRAEAAVPPLLALLRISEDDEAVHEELPVVFGMIGPAAIPPVAAFLSGRPLPEVAAGIAMEGLKEIAGRHPACRGECIGVLVQTLGSDQPTVNGFAVGTLLDMKAVEAIEAIRDAFRRKAVDMSICGDLEDAEVELGLREGRATPAPRYQPEFPVGAAFPIMEGARRTSPAPAPAKVGRNDPCPCGSGKKYKKCCLP